MRPRVWVWSLALILLAAHGALGQEAAAGGLREYGSFPWIGSRTAVWIGAEVHLMFAAVVLGVPMFAVVAEGIETAAQLEFLQKLGCQFGQGYYFSRPVVAEEAEKLIGTHAINFFVRPLNEMLELAGVQ